MIKGKERLLYLNIGGNFLPVACLTSNNFSETSETIKTTTRENAGWSTSLVTNQSYSIEISGYMTLNSGVISYQQLTDIKRSRQIIEWKITTLGGLFIDFGKGTIISISETNEVEDMIGFSATLEGFGKPGLTTESNLFRIYAGPISGPLVSGQMIKDELTPISTASNSFTFYTGTTRNNFAIAIPNDKTLQSVRNEATTESLIYTLSDTITTVPDENGVPVPMKVYTSQNALAFSNNYPIKVTMI